MFTHLTPRLILSIRPLRPLIVFLLFCLFLGGVDASGRTLQLEHRSKWLDRSSLDPIEFWIDQSSYVVNKSPTILASHIISRQGTYLIDETTRITNGQEPSQFLAECSVDIRSGLYRLRSGDKPILISEDIDWSIDPLLDPNWQLQFHRLNFIDCLFTGFHATGDDWYIRKLKHSWEDWIVDNMHAGEPTSDFAWYDHAIPIRMLNAIRTLEFLKSNARLDVRSDRRFIRDMVTLIARHADILADESYIYKVGHNHGLDQSFRLIQAAYYLPEFSRSNHWKEIALNRIEFEIKRSLTSEGVHIENSPMYHDGITIYISKILKSLEFMKINIHSGLEGFEEKALQFSVSILRPDGTYPQLGDTAAGRRPRADYPGFDVQSWADHFKASHPDINRFYWKEAGYFVFREGWKETGSHLVMKCGFLSSAHRHDDDSNILIYSHGEDWLIDAGMFGYSNASRDKNIRHLVMLPQSHNLTMPLKATVSSAPYGSGLQAIEDGAACHSKMFEGFHYLREVTVTDGFQIVINDRLMGEERHGAITIFKVPYDKSIEVGNGFVKISNSEGTAHMLIGHENLKVPKITSGLSEFPESIQTIGYNKYIDAKSIVFEHEGYANFRISFSATDD